MKQWLVVKDGNAARNKTSSRWFTRGYAAYELARAEAGRNADGVDDVPDDGDADDSCAADVGAVDGGAIVDGAGRGHSGSGDPIEASSGEDDPRSMRPPTPKKKPKSAPSPMTAPHASSRAKARAAPIQSGPGLRRLPDGQNGGPSSPSKSQAPASECDSEAGSWHVLSAAARLIANEHHNAALGVGGVIASHTDAAASASSSGDTAAVLATQIANDINSKLDKLLKPKELEVRIPALTLGPFVKTWDHPPDGDQKKRHRYPKDAPEAIAVFDDYKEFVPYTKLNTKMQDAGSLDKVLNNLNRFFALIVIDGPCTFIGALCGLHKAGLIHDMFSLPLLDHKYGWVRWMIGGLLGLAKFSLVLCRRDHWDETARLLNGCIDECLTGLMKQNNRRRLALNSEHLYKDFYRLEDFPEVACIKQAVKAAMAKIAVIHRHCLDTVPYKLRLEAATALAGIIYYNAFAGRCGEWEQLEREYVKDELAQHCDYVICKKHKTVNVYGHIAKHVPAGNLTAFKLYMQLPGKETGQFIEPPTATATSGRASVPGLLKRFGQTALQKEDPPTSTFIRKMFHSSLLRIAKEKDLMRLMERVDAHSAAVASRVYAIKSPRDDAELARLLFLDVYGEPVSFPSDEEIDAFGFSIESLVDHYSAVPLSQIEDPPCDEDQFLLVCDPDNEDNIKAAPGFDMPMLTDWDGPEVSERAVVPWEAPDATEAPEPETPRKSDVAGPPGGQPVAPKKVRMDSIERAYWGTVAPRDALYCVFVPQRPVIEDMVQWAIATGKIRPGISVEAVRMHLRKISLLENTERIARENAAANDGNGDGNVGTGGRGADGAGHRRSMAGTRMGGKNSGVKIEKKDTKAKPSKAGKVMKSGNLKS